MKRFGAERSSLQGLTGLACENNRHGNITMTLSLNIFWLLRDFILDLGGWGLLLHFILSKIVVADNSGLFSSPRRLRVDIG